MFSCAFGTAPSVTKLPTPRKGASSKASSFNAANGGGYNSEKLNDNAKPVWYVLASMGYTTYQDAYKDDGNTVAGRLGIGCTALSWKKMNFGVEAGVQSGNRMRLGVSQSTLDLLGGLPIQSTIKPLADLLATAQIDLTNTGTVFALAKVGAAYRQWQFDRNTISNIKKIDGELQVGLGIKLSSRTNLVAYYQGIYSGKVSFTVDSSAGPANATGRVHDIPTQNGGFLGIEMFV